MAALDIGIAGAGLLGRLLAWQLAGLGHRVTLHDPASGPHERAAAGWTAAGMLSPWAELECADVAVAALGVRSLDLWERIVAELPEPVHLRRDGSLLLAHASDLGAAQRLLTVLAAKVPLVHAAKVSPANTPVANVPIASVQVAHAPLAHAPRALTRAQVAELEPAIHGPAHAWMLDGEGSIHTVQAMAALAAGATARGAQWHWQHAVQRVTAGAIDDARYDHVFDVRGVGARPDLDVRGVRGEILWLHAPGMPLGRPLRLLHPRWRVYLVPRPGDIVVVGASEIESEDRSPVSVRTLLGLLSAAHSVLPDLAEARLVHSETNLRPALPDNLPRMERADGVTRINGLFRHGWLIAPAMVEDACAEFAQ